MIKEGYPKNKQVDPLKYTNKSSNIKFWIVQLIKLPLLMLIPLNMYTQNNPEGYRIFIESLILYYDNEYGFYVNVDVFTLIMAYILAIPGFYYVRKLRSAGPEKSVWKLGVGIIIVSQLFFYVMRTPIILPDTRYIYWIPSYIMPLYIMLGYVIGPLFNRQIQSVVNTYNRRHIGASRWRNFKKVHFPIWLLILILMVGPVIIIYQQYTYDYGSVYYTVFTLFYYGSGNIYPYNGGLLPNMVSFTHYISITLSFFPVNIITGAFCLFNILFVERMIQYYHGRHSQMELIKYGLLGMIWPIIIWYIIESLVAPSYGMTAAIPIPILFLTGLIVMKVGSSTHHVCSKVFDQIWDDETTESKIPETYPEIVEVPIWYTFISRFRKNQRTWVTYEKVEPSFIEDIQHDEIRIPWWYSIISRFRNKKEDTWNPNEDIDSPWSTTPKE